MSDSPFRPQSPARVNWEFQNDSMRGLKAAVTNNQPLLALEYIHRIFVDIQERLDSLESQLKEKKVPTKRSTEVSESV